MLALPIGRSQPSTGTVTPPAIANGAPGGWQRHVPDVIKEVVVGRWWQGALRASEPPKGSLQTFLSPPHHPWSYDGHMLCSAV